MASGTGFGQPVGKQSWMVGEPHKRPKTVEVQKARGCVLANRGWCPPGPPPRAQWDGPGMLLPRKVVAHEGHTLVPAVELAGWDGAQILTAGAWGSGGGRMPRTAGPGGRGLQLQLEEL